MPKRESSHIFLQIWHFYNAANIVDDIKHNLKKKIKALAKVKQVRASVQKLKKH